MLTHIRAKIVLPQVKSMAGKYTMINTDCIRLFSADAEANLWSKEEIDERIEKLCSFDRVCLARTMTILESTRRDHRLKSMQLLKELESRFPQSSEKKSIRIGFCGAPGAGKSSLIEKVGMHICKKGKRLAVLAIDPSSQKTGGSILGDKTRMEELAIHDNAFVRPSSTRGIVGGLAINTSEMVKLCESIGYQVIFIESVGLGQNETDIDNIADFVVYVVPPGSGDSLQGIKKGIMEIADLIAINKYDGDYEPYCKRLKMELSHAIHFMVPRYEGWMVPVILCSAKTNKNIDELWNIAEKFSDRYSSAILKKRFNQSLDNMWSYLTNILMRTLREKDDSNPCQEIINDVKHKLLKKNGFLPYEGAIYIRDKLFTSFDTSSHKENDNPTGI